MAFAYAPFSHAWLVFILLQPLWIAVQHSSPNQRIWRGWLFGVGYFPIGAYWFVQTLRDHLDYSWTAALAGHFLITGACALAPTVFCWLGGYLKAKPLNWLIALAALWVVIEDIRFQAFGGGPWMSLGLSQIDMPFAGFYPVFGELGTSFFVALVVGLISFVFILKKDMTNSQNQLKPRLLTLGFIVLALVSAEALKTIEWTQKVGDKQTLAIAQTAVSQSERSNLLTQVDRLNDLASISETYLGKAKLIVWPETVVTLDRADVDQTLEKFNENAMFARSTILLGAYEPSMTGKRYNTAFTLGYESGQSYRKRHLVPFGEYIPRPLSFLTGYVPGDLYRILGRTPSLIANTGTLYGISICWEGSFSRDISPLTRLGAHVLINIANEAWFSGSTLPEQNLDAMRVRAIENGRYAVRVANFGPGAIIDEKGKIHTFIQGNVPSSDEGFIQPRIGITPFIFLGEDLITLVALLILIIIFVKNREKKH